MLARTDLGWTRLVAVLSSDGQSLAHLDDDTALDVTMGRVASLASHAAAASLDASARVHVTATAASITVACGVRSVTVAREGDALDVTSHGARSRFERTDSGSHFAGEDGVRVESYVAAAIAALPAPRQLGPGASKGES